MEQLRRAALPQKVNGMRLLVVDEEIIAGGVETLRRQLMPELARQVTEIVWVLPGHAADQYRELAERCGNVRTETLNSPGGLGRLKEGVARRVSGAVPRRLVDERLGRLAREHGCDVCMTTCTFGQEMPVMQLPVVGFVSDVNPALPERIRDNICKWVERAVRTFTISDFTCSELTRLKPACAEKIYSIPLAPPRGVKAGGNVTRGSFYYPAAPNAHKNHLTLLEAARGVAERGIEFRLTFTGAGMDGFARPGAGNEVIGRMRSYLEDNRTLLDGRVTVMGDEGDAEVARLFAEASCVVLPSSYEGYGLPLAEALAYGKRVICADIAPFREQIERHGCERLATMVPVRDAGALEEAMLRHLKEDTSAEYTAEELQERLGRWTWTDAAERCRKLLEEVAGRG